MLELKPYDPLPHYPPLGDRVSRGWHTAAQGLPDGPLVLALDGPGALDWDAAIAGLSAALADRGVTVNHFDVRAAMLPWVEIQRRTASPRLADDPDFATLATGTLADLYTALPRASRPAAGVLLVYGPGAALVDHDVLWYADLPKRFAEAAIADGRAPNLGQPPGSGPGTTRRLFYIDWPLVDRHRDAIASYIERWIDTQWPDPSSIDGATLRSTLERLAAQPLRTRPTFNTTSWGGHWGQRQLGFNPTARSTALGYELIAPESGVLVGDDAEAIIEVPFQLLVALNPRQVLGEPVHALFGTSFPIRFDYLDTLGGGNLSVHCHPRSDDMRTIFGWPYTQHESYYMMVSGEGCKVFLGLRDGVDVDAFRAAAHQAHVHGQPFNIERFVATFPAEAHRLFLVPAGTPHGSGEGNVVLEVSATPYLYSLRFYDWLRRDHAGKQRPVHVEHAFRNLDTDRSGPNVARDLVQTPRTLRAGSGWREEVLGSLAEMFFEVRRVTIEADTPVEDDASTGFHVLNVVDGDGIVVDTRAGYRHTVAYAETLVVPAAVGAYTLRRVGSGRVRVVKALVRQ